MLETAIAPVRHDVTTTDAHILFDEGAQRSFITDKLARELNITNTQRESIQLSAFGDTGTDIRHLESTTIMLLLSNGETIPLSVLVPDIAIPMQNYVTKDIASLPYLKGLRFAHPLTTDDKFQISLLIGADLYWNIVGNNVIRGEGPTAVSSKLGYLLSGPIHNSRAASNSSVYLNIISQRNMDDEDVTNFWRLESLGINSNETDEDLEYLRTYQMNSIKHQDNHYIAKLLWKQDHEELPSNYTIAKARTESTIRKLSREPELLQKYSELINDQEKRGFIEKVDVNDDVTAVHYIPHHAVKKDSITTPIRIVYDYSYRKSPAHTSLNDCLMSTPPVTNDITKILMRFRLNKFAVSTDIEKAFLHIQLEESDRDFTRFFLLSDPKNPNSQLMTYRLKSSYLERHARHSL